MCLIFSKEFLPEDKLSEICVRQKQLQEKDQRLHEVQERLGEYEQRLEDYHSNLMAIKEHMQFNERLTRMLTRENQMLNIKLAHKERLKGSNYQGTNEGGQNTSRKEICSFHEAQETCENRYFQFLSLCQRHAAS